MNFCHAIAASAMVIVMAGAAQASTLAGSTATFQYYAYGGPYDFAGSPATFNVPNGSPINFGGYFQLSVTDTQIVYTYLYSGAWSPSGASLNAGGLYIDNGSLTSFSGAAPITSVFIDPSSNLGISGFNASDVTFNSSAVAVTWMNQFFSPGNSVILDVNAVPLPGALSMFGAGLAGFGALGWRKARRKAA